MGESEWLVESVVQILKKEGTSMRVWLLIGLMIWCAVGIAVAQPMEASEWPVDREGTFCIHYGEIDEDVLTHLAGYDVVILEPRLATRGQILWLKSTGTRVYGYLSVVEQNRNNIEFPSLRERWFYRPGETRLYNAEWESYYMDLRQSGYRRFLLEQVVVQIAGKHLDGVMIDTIGDLDDLRLFEEVRDGMVSGYRDLLKQIKWAMPDLEIIQNWGFRIAVEEDIPLDGILWEGFSMGLLETDEWSRQRFAEIEHLGLPLYRVAPHSDTRPISDAILSVYTYVRDTSLYD